MILTGMLRGAITSLRKDSLHQRIGSGLTQGPRSTISSARALRAAFLTFLAVHRAIGPSFVFVTIFIAQLTHFPLSGEGMIGE